MTEMKWDGDRVKRLVSEAGQAALFTAAGFGREQANRSVPLEEGTLQGSGGIEVDGTTAAIYYDSPYAVVQHERTDYRHDPGRRAKWLELTLQEKRRDIRNILAKGVGKAFG